MKRVIVFSGTFFVLAVAGCASTDNYSMQSDRRADADYLAKAAKDTTPPPMAAGRKINDQDCTKGVDITAGNLRCK